MTDSGRIQDVIALLRTRGDVLFDAKGSWHWALPPGAEEDEAAVERSAPVEPERIIVLDGTGPDDPVDAMLHALAARDEHGSYLELTKALEKLALHDPYTHRLLTLCYPDSRESYIQHLTPDDLTDGDLLSLLSGLVLIAARMPAVIRVPQFARDFSKEQTTALHAARVERLRVRIRQGLAA